MDFSAIFSKMAANNYKSWAVLEWECSLKDSVHGATEGAPCIADHIIKVTGKSSDDFAAGSADKAKIKRILGI